MFRPAIQIAPYSSLPFTTFFQLSKNNPYSFFCEFFGHKSLKTKRQDFETKNILRTNRRVKLIKTFMKRICESAELRTDLTTELKTELTRIDDCEKSCERFFFML